MDGAQHDALRSRRVRALELLGAELKGDRGVDADAEAYRYRATPKPIVIAPMKFWTGKTSDSAVIASSLICATK